ncbi:hypothetical protein [Hansschlegelia zhihuaiae]|uniref:Uncharacterized protein n=1 Tax=Hansschlegelia zhihuaiae TaxID=405005 RepID=A0A4Q0MJE1_9HYPH|nr:hypothetical protein [Hansschlegelia zhihuaiae]RXF73209.1 hypothetical protein EK403_12080 [Hansschlegelia zhihuaiae]
MISPEEAAAAAMTAEAAMPDPALMALSMKSLALDLPLAIAVETIRFNVRIAMAWLDHVGRVAALSPSAASDVSFPDDGPAVRVAPQRPVAVAARLAA